MEVNADRSGATVFLQKYNQNSATGQGFIEFGTKDAASFATILELCSIVISLAAGYLEGIKPLNSSEASGESGPTIDLAKNHFVKIILIAGMAAKIAKNGMGKKDQYPYQLSSRKPFEELEPEQVARAGFFSRIPRHCHW